MWAVGDFPWWRREGLGDFRGGKHDGEEAPKKNTLRGSTRITRTDTLLLEEVRGKVRNDIGLSIGHTPQEKEFQLSDLTALLRAKIVQHKIP